MLGKTHMVGGAAAVAACAMAGFVSPTPELVVPAVIIGAIGGLVPDIDHPNSKISQKLKPLGKLVSIFFTHRGFFHSPAVYLLLFSIWKYWSFIGPIGLLGDCLFLGIASHLLLDFLNPKGIPLLYPITQNHWHLMKIPTGGIRENVILFFLSVAACTLTAQQILNIL